MTRPVLGRFVPKKKICPAPKCPSPTRGAKVSGANPRRQSVRRQPAAPKCPSQTLGAKVSGANPRRQNGGGQTYRPPYLWSISKIYIKNFEKNLLKKNWICGWSKFLIIIKNIFQPRPRPRRFWPTSTSTSTSTKY